VDAPAALGIRRTSIAGSVAFAALLSTIVCRVAPKGRNEAVRVDGPPGCANVKNVRDVSHSYWLGKESLRLLRGSTLS
jgi:hypothetical protein